MSYCRFGWESSDAYIFGGLSGEGRGYIECCGCMLTRDDEDEVGSAQFSNYGDLLRHLSEHRAAGHHILSVVDRLIHLEIEDPDRRWVEIGDLPDPSTLHPDPGPQQAEAEVFTRARALMAEALGDEGEGPDPTSTSL